MNLPIKRLLASDLDGTFLSHDGDITAANIEAVKLAQQSELEIVFITGRPARWLGGIAEKVNHTGLMIGGNGAFIADFSTMQVTESFCVENEIGNAVISVITEKFPDTYFAIERSFPGMKIARNQGVRYDQMKAEKFDEVQFVVTPGYAEFWTGEHDFPVVGASELMQFGSVTKLVAKPGNAENWSADDWYLAIAPLVSDLVQVTHAAQKAPLAEISALGVNKGSALAALAAEKALTADEIVAIGDMPNDIPMLQWVTESWAVGHAHPEVLAVAKNVTPSHEESPVAHLIHNLLARF